MPYVTWYGAPKEIKQIHVFIKNNQSMDRISFKEVFDEIRDFISRQGVNFGILLMADGTYVFTESEVKMDVIVVKLTTGINYHGVIEKSKSDLDILNKYLSEKA